VNYTQADELGFAYCCAPDSWEHDIMSPPKSSISNVADLDVSIDRSVTNPVVQPFSRQCALTPEFFDLISEADPHAAKDKYYVASSDFTELHSEIKGGLLRGILIWSVGLTMVLATAIYLSLQV